MYSMKWNTDFLFEYIRTMVTCKTNTKWHLLNKSNNKLAQLLINPWDQFIFISLLTSYADHVQVCWVQWLAPLAGLTLQWHKCLSRLLYDCDSLCLSWINTQTHSWRCGEKETQLFLCISFFLLFSNTVAHCIHTWSYNNVSYLNE